MRPPDSGVRRTPEAARRTCPRSMASSLVDQALQELEERDHRSEKRHGQRDDGDLHGTSHGGLLSPPDQMRQGGEEKNEGDQSVQDAAFLASRIRSEIRPHPRMAVARNPMSSESLRTRSAAPSRCLWSSSRGSFMSRA